jgi:hypothetical protein
VTESITCVVTNGGPLIALPGEVLDVWQGTSPPLGVAVPPGWEWGDGGIVCDYDRACDPPADSVTVDDSYSTWMISVGGGHGLVLDSECSTAALHREDGLVIVRDLGLMKEAEVLGLIDSVPDDRWLRTSFTIDVRSGSLFVFDSAYPGRERELADGGVLEAKLTPGAYAIAIAVPQNRGRTTFVRLGYSQRQRS